MRKPKGNDQTEWWVKNEVKKILDTTEWKYWMPSADVYGRNGISDFLCVKKPKLFMVIETKYDNTVTAQQYEFLLEIHKHGHYAFLVDETNLDVLRAFLNAPTGTMVDITSLIKWQNQNPIVDIRINKEEKKP